MMASHLYSDSLRQFRTLSHNVSAYFTDLYPLARQSLHVTLHALVLYIRLLFRAIQPILALTVYLYHVLTPPIASLLRNFLIALTLQPRHLVVFEMSVIVLIILSIWIERRYGLFHRTYSLYIRGRRRITLHYRRLQTHVRTKSKVAASALPHVIFAAVAMIFHASLARFLIPLVRGPGLVMIACVRPAFRTIYLLYAIDVAPVSYQPSQPPSSSSSPAPSVSDATPRAVVAAPSPTRALRFTPDSENTLSDSADRLDATSLSDVVRASSSSVSLPSAAAKSDSIRLRKNAKLPLSSESASSDRRRSPSTPAVRGDSAEDKEGSDSDADAAPSLTASARRVRIDDTPSCISSRSPTASILSTPLSRFQRVKQLLAMSASRTRLNSEYSTPVSSKISKSKPSESFGSMDSAARFKEERTLLTFWVAFGIVWAVRSITWYLCPSMLESFMTMVDTWMFYLFIWAQVSLTNGARFGYALFTSFLRKRGIISTKIRRNGTRAGHGLSSEAAKETVHQLGTVMRLLSSLRIFDPIKSGRIWRALTDSGVVAGIAIVFLAVPRMVTFLATIVLGVALPAVKTAITLENSLDEEANGPTSDDNDDGDSDDSDLELQRHNWLAYWSVFSLLDAIYAAGTEKFGWLPLWYHVKMAIILWLLIPRFRGTVIMLDHLMTHVGLLLSTVRKQTVTPRKRKIR